MFDTILPRPKTRVMATWKLKEQMDEGWLSLDADYQRDVKWDIEKMNYLIDSIFTNYYIPPLLFALRKVRHKNKRTAIDGKQRLTAIKKYMNNDFPYIHHETQEAKYYCKTDKVEDGRKYLSEEEMEEFNSFEFVCVEYTDITEDQEYQIFSRVQLGVAITNQEKLKAHNTPLAKICKELTEKYQELKNFFARKTELTLYQNIVYMFLTLKNDKENKEFESRVSQLFQIIRSTDRPTKEDAAIVERTLSTLYDIATDERYKTAITKRDGRPYTLKTIEMVLFMLFRKGVQRPRTIKAYATDFTELRNYLALRRGETVLMGKETFNVGIGYIEQRLLSEGLSPISRPNVYTVQDDSDSDELKQEEYEEPSTPPPVRVSDKRRKLLSGRPIARRGGKLPNGITRK